MCGAQRDVYLSQLLCLGYVGAFILLCIVLLIRKKRDNSQRQRHESGHHLHLVRSLGNITNSMFQMGIEHRRSMSRLMDRVASLEEHLKPEDGQRYGNQPQRHRRDHCETPTRSSQVLQDGISRDYLNLAEEKDRGLSQENKELQAAINSLHRQNEELTERLEAMTETVASLEEVKNSRDFEFEDLEERLHDMEMRESEHLDAAEDLQIEMFKAEYATEDLTEDTVDLQLQLHAAKQDTENVAKHLAQFQDAVREIKVCLLIDGPLSDPLSTKLHDMMEQLLSQTQGFRTQCHVQPLWPSAPSSVGSRGPSPSP